MNPKLLGFALVVILALGACSSTRTSSTSPAASVPEAKPGMGQVVFYRLNKAKGKAIRFEITDAAKGSIGALSAGAVIRHDLEPGSHTFTVRAPSVDGQDIVNVNIEAGQTQYVRGKILWGWPAGRPKFEHVSESTAKAELAKLGQ